MSNLRIIYNNAADRATLVASTEAGALVVENLLTDIKSVVWRATGTSATLTATWADAEVLGGAALSPCNLSPTATIRARVYTLETDVDPVYDSGAVLACPAIPEALWGWGIGQLGANAYSYAGGTSARVWFGAGYSGEKLVLDIVDTGNTQGYVEASRLITGAYWEPAKNADYGASVQLVDTSTNYRNDAGDLMTDTGTRSSKLAFTLSKMDPADRAAMWNILRGNGKSRPLFISLFPGSADTALEQMHQVYGKLATTPAMALPSFNIASAPLEIEGI